MASKSPSLLLTIHMGVPFLGRRSEWLSFWCPFKPHPKKGTGDLESGPRLRRRRQRTLARAQMETSPQSTLCRGTYKSPRVVSFVLLKHHPIEGTKHTHTNGGHVLGHQKKDSAKSGRPKLGGLFGDLCKRKQKATSSKTTPGLALPHCF